MATNKNHKEFFKKVLVEFIGQEDPILSMLEWTAQRMMEIEAEVAVLLVANELAVDISKYVKKVESEIKIRNK